MDFSSYSRVPLSRTRAVSNFALSRTKALLPSAFTIRLVEMCPAISNTRYLEYPAVSNHFFDPWNTFLSLSRTFFRNFFVETNLFKPFLWRERSIQFRMFTSVATVCLKFQKSYSCSHQVASRVRCQNKNLM